MPNLFLSFGTHETFLKWIGITAAALLVVVAGAVVVLSYQGRSKLSRSYGVSGLLTAGTMTGSISLAEGERQAGINVCAFCHGPDLAGTVTIDAPPFFVVALT